MEKQKMTIHRALSELKLIDAKIEKQISEISPSGVFQKGKLVNGNTTQDQFKKEAQSKFDSVNDLIERKNKIKSAVVKANGETFLAVAGKSMSIADAINFKQVVKFKRSLIATLKSRHQYTLGQVARSNEIVEGNVQKILEATFGKENVKAGKDDIDTVRKPYMDANEFHIYDPIGVLQKIEATEKEVDEFEMEVDAALSEINATTFVEI